MRSHPALWRAAAALAFCPAVLLSQGLVNGIIRDSARNLPLSDALIQMTVGAEVHSARSEQDGVFQLRNIPAGTHQVVVRRIGYREASFEIHTLDRDTSITLTVAAIPQSLDTMRAYAHSSGIFGVVGSAKDLHPLANATVQVLGAAHQATTDSAGRFFVDLTKPGTYMVRVARTGYLGHLVAIDVPAGRAVETVPLLDPVADSTRHPSDRMWKEFDQRLQFAGADAAVISAADLRKSDADNLTDAINFVPAQVRRGLRIGNAACVLVNGMPRPGWAVDQFDVEDIDAVELYSQRGDATGLLAKLWPRGTPCARAIRTVPNANQLSAAWYVVIWLKQYQ